MIDFRWVVAIALWTLISGPVLGPAGTASRARKHNHGSHWTAVKSPLKPPAQSAGRRHLQTSAR
jgi:hypothetical protein